ncbi:MAG TPA: 2-isopropylmalate synthase [Halobacteriales archaeon]|nr:2-isopropylmalate synthase [Halobacteriales archaeon]
MRQRRAIDFFQGTLAVKEPEFTEVRIFDTTLRDGEQSPHVSFSYNDKIEIATLLDEMGTHVIEAGFPVNSKAEFEAVRDISEGTETTVAGLARVIEGDILAAIDSGVNMVHVFASTSDVQIEDSMHSTREEVVEKSIDSVKLVKDAGVECMFSPMDATRTDLTFLGEVVEAVTEVGADWINIPDTCGVATPTRFGDLIRFVKEHTEAYIDVHTHDDFGLATANALAGFEAGAHQAQVSVNGIGERAGNAAYEEVVMAAIAVYNANLGIDTSRIMELSSIVEDISGIAKPPNKAIVGDNAFSHESGIHAAGVIENSDTFEPGVMTPEMVGARRQFVLGKHTGTHAVRMYLREAGFDPTETQVRDITRRVKDYGAEKKRVTKRELMRFAREGNVFREKVKE